MTSGGPLSVGLDVRHLDFESLGLAENTLRWPTGYDDYIQINETVTDSIMQGAASFALTDCEAAAVLAVTIAVISDAECAARVALDLHNAQQLGLHISFNPLLSPVIKFISATDEVLPSQLLPEDLFPLPAKPVSLRGALRRIMAPARASFEMLLRTGGGRIDMHNDCALLQSYLAAAACSPLLLRVETWSLQSSAEPSEALNEFAELAARSVARCLGIAGCEGKLAKRAAGLTALLARARLQPALKAAQAIAQMPRLNNAGDILAGATPKETGRLLNWKYHNLERDIWRFTHGGDRVFYQDPTWAVGEMPYVSRYHVHGGGEARRLVARFARTCRYKPAGGIPEFLSYGSPRHQRWVEEGRKAKKQRGKEARRVVIMGPAVLGDALMAPLNFKPPDPILADTRAQLIRILKNGGYEVVFKPHPKGLLAACNLHEPAGVGAITHSFDPLRIEADCFVFDFAGSAFFDALAGNKGIVLIDSGVRPWDLHARRDLEKRCQIVPAQFDEHNRSRVDANAFLMAVEQACDESECPREFAEAYFYS